MELTQPIGCGIYSQRDSTSQKGQEEDEEDVSMDLTATTGEGQEEDEEGQDNSISMDLTQPIGCGIYKQRDSTSDSGQEEDEDVSMDLTAPAMGCGIYKQREGQQEEDQDSSISMDLTAPVGCGIFKQREEAGDVSRPDVEESFRQDESMEVDHEDSSVSMDLTQPVGCGIYQQCSDSTPGKAQEKDEEDVSMDITAPVGCGIREAQQEEEDKSPKTFTRGLLSEPIMLINEPQTSSITILAKPYNHTLSTTTTSPPNIDPNGTLTPPRRSNFDSLDLPPPLHPPTPPTASPLSPHLRNQTAAHTTPHLRKPHRGRNHGSDGQDGAG